MASAPRPNLSPATFSAFTIVLVDGVMYPTTAIRRPPRAITVYGTAQCGRRPVVESKTLAASQA